MRAKKISEMTEAELEASLRTIYENQLKEAGSVVDAVRRKSVSKRTHIEIYDANSEVFYRQAKLIKERLLEMHPEGLISGESYTLHPETCEYLKIPVTEKVKVLSISLNHFGKLDVVDIQLPNGKKTIVTKRDFLMYY